MTYPHLKDYEYPMTTKQLETAIIEVLKTDSGFKYIVTDSTGTMEDRNYYMTVEHKYHNNSLAYHITYSNIDKSHCKLGLVGVFDITNKSGGYRFEDKGVEQLVYTFDKQLVDKIK